LGGSQQQNRLESLQLLLNLRADIRFSDDSEYPPEATDPPIRIILRNFVRRAHLLSRRYGLILQGYDILLAAISVSGPKTFRRIESGQGQEGGLEGGKLGEICFISREQGDIASVLASVPLSLNLSTVTQNSKVESMI